jgi:hypothetical protein
MSRKTTPESFWCRVKKQQSCWEWQGAVNSTGYGNLAFHGKSVTAHRVAAFLSGLISDIHAPKDRKGSGFILHSCDNRRCCNPAHMSVGTYAENQAEAYTRRRRKAHKGSDHANAKQTRKSIMLIKDMYAHGVSQEAIALLLQVSQSGISKILLGASYGETV